jgi:hypothetical protein
LTANQLGLAIGQRAEQISNERFDNCRFSRSGIAANDHESAAVVENVIEGATQSGTLLSPADDVVGPGRRARSRRSNHKHYRATWL